MNGETNIPKDLQEIVGEALGGKYKVTFARWVQQELKSDKTDTKILVLTTFRLLLLNNKSPRKVESNIPLLDISAIESKTPQKSTSFSQALHQVKDGQEMVKGSPVAREIKERRQKDLLRLVLLRMRPLGKQKTRWIRLAIYTEAKRIPLTTSGETNGRIFDSIILHIFLSLSNIFPDVSIEKLVARIEVLPNARLTEICDQKQSLLPKDPGPCGNFSVAYRCICDHRGVEVMEDVAWDVDNIYLAQDTREFCLSDFDYLDQKHILLMFSVLQHNSWFSKLNISEIKLTPEIISEVRKILKSNSAIRELILVNSGIRTELVGKLVKSLMANSSPALCSLNLSGNSIEDKSVKSLCSLISSLPHGLVELHLSGCALTSRGINSLSFAFSQGQNTSQNLRVLDLSENSTKGEDIPNLYAFFAKENVLETVRLTSMDCSLESLISSLYPGCCKTLRHLDLSGNSYGKKHGKDAVCPQAWKQFFSSAISLKSVNLAGCRLPSDAVKSVLLGIACNEAVKDLKLSLSGNGLAESGASEVLEVSLPTVSNISSLDISDNSFDVGLAIILAKIAQNKCLKRLFIGRNLATIKPKNLSLVMDAVVQLIQEDGSPIESLSLENMRLKGDTSYVINALGANNSLKELDISGNQMGDSGAKMLSKALLINKSLTSISLDNNGITLSGFQELAAAVEKNYTVKKIPTPLNDVANAHRVNPEKTELAWKKISAALERNHNPRKLAMEQSFRLQQGLFISSYKEVLDNSLVKLDASIQKMESSGSSLPPEVELHLSKAGCLTKDALATRELILELQRVALKSDEDSLIQSQLNAMVENLQAAITGQIEVNVSEMVQCAQKQCPGILSDKDFRDHLVSSVSPGNLLPKGFVQQLILEQVATDVANKMNEMNLKVATFMSENMMEQLLMELKATTASLAAVRSSPSSTEVLEKETEKKESVEMRVTRPSLASSSGQESDSEIGQNPLGERRKSRMNRGLRPQSSIVVSRSSQMIGTQEPVDEAVVMPVAPPRKRRSQDFSASFDKRPMSLMAVMDDGPKSSEGSGDQFKAVEEPGSKANSKRPPYLPSVSADFQAEIRNALKKFPIEEQEEEEEEEKKEEKEQEHGRKESESDFGAKASPSPLVKQGFELPPVTPNHAPTQKLNHNLTQKSTQKQVKADDMTLETTDQKLSHLGIDRPKRLKNIAATRPTIGQRIEEEDELTKGVDEFFAAKYSSGGQNNGYEHNGAKDKAKKQPGLLPTKPGKTKTAEDLSSDKEKKKSKK